MQHNVVHCICLAGLMIKLLEMSFTTWQCWLAEVLHVRFLQHSKGGETLIADNVHSAIDIGYTLQINAYIVLPRDLCAILIVILPYVQVVLGLILCCAGQWQLIALATIDTAIGEYQHLVAFVEDLFDVRQAYGGEIASAREGE